jgi:hypothetical protein
MQGRIGGVLCVGALLLAGEAHAEPVALLDAPRATGLALAGSEVLVGRPTRGGGARIDALPAAGGPPRRLLTVPARRDEAFDEARLAASAQRVAVVLLFEEGGFPVESQLWTGPPAGPLVLERRVRFSEERTWAPIALDVDGDRVLVFESHRDRPYRARVLAPGAPPHVIPWPGSLRPPVALAGDRAAFVAAEDGRHERVFVVDWRTGTVLSRTAAGIIVDLDLAADGRVVTQVERGALAAPRFAGDRVAALEHSRFRASRPVLLDPGGARVPLGLPSNTFAGFAADGAGAAWIANGCVLYAPLTGPAPTEPPSGPCPRAEVLVEETDQRLHGRRIRFVAKCVAAPAAGCRGTVHVRGANGKRVLGRGRFRVPAGDRRRVDIVLNRSGIRYVDARLRRADDAFFEVHVRIPGGRRGGGGGSGAVVYHPAGRR